MTKHELNRFRVILSARVVELDILTSQRDAVAIQRNADQLEEIQQASERSLAVCNLDRDFNQLRIARTAILRIHKGSFGMCEQCTEAIAPKRLAAVPWTQFCIRCQEAIDRNPTRGLLVRAA